jgi:dephospho-CoA kinase
MAVIGITGGIGCGKSTFTRMLAEILDAPLFDTDAAAKQLLDTDPEVRELVTREVLATAYGPNGKADRPALRKLVFSDPAAKARLEGILHPRVRARWMLEAGQSRGHFLVEIPLLFETGAQALFNHIVTVACSEKTQIHRISARGLADSEALSIIRSQLALARKVELAHFVVWNDGSLENLRQQALEFAARIRPGNQPADHT